VLRAGRSISEVFTIGHSRHDGAAFVALLQSHAVELLADVRRKPWSGRHPQFNRDRLAKTLSAASIEYRHFEALGGMRAEAAGPSPNGAWRSGFLRAYADHALTAEFATALGELSAAARHRRTAVMCAEADWHDCHRQVLADYLIAGGFAVRHIAPDGALAEGRLAATARIEGPQRVVYPAATARQGTLDI
jgi:uncharacterized protein (DUF488 family)